jgi:hypothetical protein
VVGDTRCSRLSTTITDVSIKEANDLLMQDSILKTTTTIFTQSCEQLMPLFSVLLIIVYVENYDYVQIKFWELSASSNVSL